MRDISFTASGTQHTAEWWSVDAFAQNCTVHPAAVPRWKSIKITSVSAIIGQTTKSWNNNCGFCSLFVCFFLNPIPELGLLILATELNCRNQTEANSYKKLLLDMFSLQTPELLHQITSVPFKVADSGLMFTLQQWHQLVLTSTSIMSLSCFCFSYNSVWSQSTWCIFLFYLLSIQGFEDI